LRTNSRRADKFEYHTLHVTDQAAIIVTCVVAILLITIVALASQL
jgi:hypothetical protein